MPSAPPTLVAQPLQSTPKRAPKSPVKQQLPVVIDKQPPCEDYNDDDASCSPDKRKMVIITVQTLCCQFIAPETYEVNNVCCNFFIADKRGAKNGGYYESV